MIIIKLQGGLGNQIFQYCFARSLSYKLNKELFIDISYFTHEKPHHAIYGLHPFNIKGIIGNYPLSKTTPSLNVINKTVFFLKNKNQFNDYKLSNLIFEDVTQNTENKIKKYMKEPHNTVWGPETNWDIDMFNSIDTEIYFDGYFQFEMDSKYRLYISERFFNENNELIHNDLKYLPDLTKESQTIVNDMKNTNSVLLHVRRGDYNGLLDFGLCSEEYYEKSIEIIASKIDNPKFFIFSDDIEEAKKLNINYLHVFVDFKDNTELVGRGNGELLKLMSSCKHFIIANSSLSWWAAFLSENENKIIISPKPWFQSRRIMGTHTIDNKKTIQIINNNAKIFNDNEKTLYDILDDKSEFKNLKYEKTKNGYKINNINKNSQIILKNKNKNNGKFIIKLSLESNHYNCLKIFFKTKNKNKYSNDNVFKVYYYEDDDFEHYLEFPNDAIIDDLKIKPGSPTNNNQDYLIIKSLEIKEINK